MNLGLMWMVRNSTLSQRRLTVPLHSPNGWQCLPSTLCMENVKESACSQSGLQCPKEYLQGQTMSFLAMWIISKYHANFQMHNGILIMLPTWTQAQLGQKETISTLENWRAHATKQGKSEGFESCDRPIVRKRPIWVKIGDVLYRVTLKFYGWPWKTIGHLSFAVSSFVQHFIAIGEFKLELQSGNAPIWVKFDDF